MKRKLIVNMLILTTIFNTSISVYADTLEEQLKQYNDNISNSQSELSAYESKEQDIVNKIQELDNKIESSKYNISILESQITEVDAKIAKNEDNIVQINQDIEKEREQTESYVRSLYKQEIPPYLQILFKSKGITNILDATKAYSTLVKQNNITIAKLNTLIKDLEEQEKEMQDNKIAMEKSKNNIVLITKELESNISDQNIQLVSLQNVRIYLQDKISKEQEAANGVLAEIEEQRRIEEKKKADEEAKKEAERKAEEERKHKLELEQQQQVQQPQTPIEDTTDDTYEKPVTGSGTGLDIVSYASNFLGVPYVWGGTTPDGFDCSGLVQYLYRHYGYTDIPRVSQDQQNYGMDVSLDSLQPGDLLFFGRPATHVAIYVKDGYMLHAPQTGDVVKIQAINLNNVTSAKRIIK